MDFDTSYFIPLGIFLLAIIIRTPLVELTKIVKERRKYDRRSDRRMKRFRRQENELVEDTYDNNRKDNDRRDITQERRRRERRALERIKRV